MVTTVGTESEAVDLLKDLIGLDYAAIEAYRAASERLENKLYAQKLDSFCEDHERHTRNLAPFVREFGEDPPQKAGAKALLTKGKVTMAGLIGDKPILAAMKTNEDDTNTAYERAAAHKGLGAELRKILTQNLADERRHRAWIVETLNAL